MDTLTRGKIGTTIVLVGAIGITSLAWSTTSGQEPTVRPTPSPGPHRVYLELTISNDTPAHVRASRERPPGAPARSLANHHVSKQWSWTEIVQPHSPTRYQVIGTVTGARQRGTLACRIKDGNVDVATPQRKVFRPSAGDTTTITCRATVG